MFSKLTWLWRLLPWQLGASCPRFIQYLKSSSLIFALWWQSTISSDTTWLTRQFLCRFWRKVTKRSGLACSRCLKCSPRREWTIVRSCRNTTTGKEDVIVCILHSVTLSSKYQLLKPSFTQMYSTLEISRNCFFFIVRDDALRLWKAISTFMRQVTSIYYKSDKDVAKDTELHAWLLDIHENGFPVGESGIDRELPKSISTLDQLVHVLTCIVFTCSCQHAAVNFGLMDVAGFIPNTPHLMRRPPPTKKNEASLKSIMKTLPNKSQAAHQIAFLYVLTQFAEDEVRIVTC